MATSNSTFVSGLYQVVLARNPDAGGLSYWASGLDSGFTTRAQVAHGFFSAPEYAAEIQPVGRLYYASFGRMPDMAGMQFWINMQRQGASLDQIATQFVYSPEFSQVNGPVSNLGSLVDTFYANILDRAADPVGRADWIAALQGGASVGAVLNGFARSPEFQGRANPLVTNAIAYNAIAGRAPTDVELASAPADLQTIVLGALSKAQTTAATVNGLSYSTKTFTESAANDGTVSASITISLTGDTFAGGLGAALGVVSGVPKGMTGSVAKVSDTTATFMLTGNADAHGIAATTSALKLVFAGKDFTSTSIAGKAGVTQLFKVAFSETPPFSEVNGSLVLNGSITTALKIDLTADTFYFGTTPGTLAAGSMANVVNVDASGITGTNITATLTGDAASNTLVAPDLNTTLKGAAGDDQLTLGAGADRIVFAGTAASNGVDAINGYTLGEGGDILDFSSFLNRTGTTHITPVASTATANSAWSSADVLVATGYSLDSAAEIAALFSAGGVAAPYAAPAVAGKVVVITADIVGDASIWYIVNQTAPTAIDSSEVTLVGTLAGVNNLGLSGYGFTAANFA